MSEAILQELVALSHHLGEEARDYLIIGEGNTSARIDAETFWVKASGVNLRSIDASDFVRVHQVRVIELLKGEATDEETTRALEQARIDAHVKLRPSVETVLHAVLYDLTDAQFVGHTHASAANAILCSPRASDIARHIMPDVIVVCGSHMIYVPYTDPGVPLAREVAACVRQFIADYDEMPHVVWLQNHGLFALGQSALQVQNVTQMAVKHARVLSGALQLGEPHWLSEHDIARIHTRPDEEVRRVKFK